ncbi:hypothetical protein [uncultured Bosea sp.]|uniref:hypothetical protein n=1 Tax=uncultured Bosea sp. TaxID=211457 RepID=UPI0025E120F7|nr:hypothetical protein [uncultured Bosea sp.]
MTTSFHATLASIAAYRATMLVECLIGCVADRDARLTLARNMRHGHSESSMNVADALVQSCLPGVEIWRGYSYDRVIQELPDEVIDRSALRAFSSIPADAVIDDNRANILRRAIAAELSYLWLKTIERSYDEPSGDHPTEESDATGQEPAAAVGTVRRINPMDCEAVVDLKPLLNGHLPVDVGDRLYASSQYAQPALRRLAAALRWCRNSLGHHFHPELRDAVENALSSDGAEQPGAWRWTAKGDSEPFLRLSGDPMHVGGDVVAVKPLFA